MRFPVVLRCPHANYRVFRLGILPLFALHLTTFTFLADRTGPPSLLGAIFRSDGKIPIYARLNIGAPRNGLAALPNLPRYQLAHFNAPSGSPVFRGAPFPYYPLQRAHIALDCRVGLARLPS